MPSVALATVAARVFGVRVGDKKPQIRRVGSKSEGLAAQVWNGAIEQLQSVA
jgi:hypothetical protein